MKRSNMEILFLNLKTLEIASKEKIEIYNFNYFFLNIKV